MRLSPAALLKGPGEVLAMGADVVKFSFTSKFQLREYVEQAAFVMQVTLMPTILVSIPFGAVIALQVASLTGQLGAQSFAGATAVEIGFLSFRNPTGMIAIIEGLAKWCDAKGIARVADLTGAMRAHPPRDTYEAGMIGIS